MNAALKLTPTASRLEVVNPDDLHKVWDLVRPCLEMVRIRAGVRWKAEDVYHALRNRDSLLQLGYVEDTFAGVLVTTATQDPFTGEKVLIVWACFSSVGGALDFFEPLVRKSAKDAGFSRLIFQSRRKGWLRRLLRRGWRLQNYIIEVEL